MLGWADLTMTRRAAISVGEPWDFEASDGPNRLVVEYTGIVPGPTALNWAPRYLLLRVVNAFDYDAERVEWLVASPRYEGVTLEMLAEEGGTAGFARLRPSAKLVEGKPFGPQEVDYFMIGDLTFTT